MIQIVDHKDAIGCLKMIKEKKSAKIFASPFWWNRKRNWFWDRKNFVKNKTSINLWKLINSSWIHVEYLPAKTRLNSDSITVSFLLSFMALLFWMNDTNMRYVHETVPFIFFFLSTYSSILKSRLVSTSLFLNQLCPLAMIVLYFMSTPLTPVLKENRGYQRY